MMNGMTNEEATKIIKKEFSEYKDTLSVYAKKRKKAFDMAINALESQAKRKHGKWINVEDRTDWLDATYECSCCGREILTPYYKEKNNLYSDYPYCHCGAKMEEKEVKNDR